MSRTRYRNFETEYPYFQTSTIVGWLPVFTRREAVEIVGKGSMHRVRIGPYNRLDDINRVRATLTQNGVDASLIRLKDPQKQ